eukprot:TRINITY_DN51409_c0_g1_i1.p1 TRINITY_DN51409_c0_g1~~TRINITY_DN51409_c0_g1_i1.p1  ORF type:complete len:530 (+),score=146.30 TRINITY_DN51409_c0_g1_i1:66-1655(+)
MPPKAKPSQVLAKAKGRASPEPKGKAKAKADAKAKAGPASPAAGSGAAAARQVRAEAAERDPKVLQAEKLLQDCLEEEEIARVDGRVLDIAVGQARLLEGTDLDSELLKKAEARLEEFLAFEVELKKRAQELRAQKDATIEIQNAENDEFTDAFEARQKMEKEVENLFNAIEDSDLGKIKKYIQHNVTDVSKEGAFPAPPLPLDVEDHEGNTPLSEAACYGEAEIVEYLLSIKAHPNVRNAQGRTPLFRATYNGHEDIVKLLLETGGDPTIENNDGEPAGKMGTAGTKKLISEWDKSNTLVRQEELTSLQRLEEPWPRLLLKACKAGDSEAVKSVLDAISAESADEEKTNIIRTIVNFEEMVDALWMACTLGHLELCKLLLDAGADVNSFSKQGLTCLMICCRKGHTVIVQELLSRGAKTHLRSVQGRLASDYAREYGDGHYLHDIVIEHCRKTEDWSTLEEEARQSEGNKACSAEAANDLIERRKNVGASDAATAALKALPVSELREGSDRYKELLEQRALADVLGMG